MKLYVPVQHITVHGKEKIHYFYSILIMNRAAATLQRLTNTNLYYDLIHYYHFNNKESYTLYELEKD